jgi:hypothetical protein
LGGFSKGGNGIQTESLVPESLEVPIRLDSLVNASAILAQTEQKNGNFRFADHPTGTRTNGSSMSALA